MTCKALARRIGEVLFNELAKTIDPAGIEPQGIALWYLTSDSEARYSHFL